MTYWLDRVSMRTTVVVAVLLYLLAGLAFATYVTSGYDREPFDPFGGPLSFLAWFVLPALLWPANVSGRTGIDRESIVLVYIALVVLTTFAIHSFRTRSSLGIPRR